MKLKHLKNKSIAIWGFGVEGKACAKYLSNKNIAFKVLCNEDEKVADYACITQDVDENLLNQFDVIIKSPGISPYSQVAKNTKAQITSPTALWFVNEKDTFVIAVTGTKGKSTTVSLLAHILASCGKKTNLVGNIGEALIGSSNDYDYIVLEASSFQIFDGEIKAEIAVVTNLYTEHIDWHDGVDNYFKDKLKILKNAEMKILNAKNSTLNSLVNDNDAVFFNHENSYHIKNNTLYFIDDKVIDIAETQLIGRHNLENIAAAMMVCNELKLDDGKILAAIKSFKPLAHRLQQLGKIGLHFAINDSIATTPMATIAALKTMDLKTTCLILGGYDRGHDWLSFVHQLEKKSPFLTVIAGANGSDIKCLIDINDKKIEYIMTDGLKNAVKIAKSKTPVDGTILLSPGAPSFDQFDNYIQRGQFFEQQMRLGNKT